MPDINIKYINKLSFCVHVFTISNGSHELKQAKELYNKKTEGEYNFLFLDFSNVTGSNTMIMLVNFQSIILLKIKIITIIYLSLFELGFCVSIYKNNKPAKKA